MISNKVHINKRIAIAEKTVVIIGASSGIGRATALAFAKEGTTLILVARREKVLMELALECKRHGARRAVPVMADVTEAESLQKVIEVSMQVTGRIDVWINNAGIGAVGDFNRIPLQVHQQVINTSLIGHINGTYSVLPVFKKQGYGVIINTISVGAWVPEPYAVSYTASKYGLRGFSESLRCELRHLRCFSNVKRYTWLSAWR
jgi:short-subunit dehydrogenase